MATNPCGSGQSGVPKPGVQGIVALAGVAIGDILLKGRAAWAYDIAVAMGYISFDAQPFCAGGRPDLPNVDAARLASYFSPLNPHGAADLYEDFTDIVGHFIWDDICQCSDGSTPPVAPPFPAPPGFVLDPPQLSNPTGTPCGPGGNVFETKNFDSSGNLEWDWQTGQFLTSSTTWIQFRYSAGHVQPPLPYPVSHTLIFRPAGSTTVLGTYQWTQTALIPNTAREIHSVAVPAGATSMRFLSHTDTAPGGGFGMDFLLSEYCGAVPRQLDESCCPPDPAITQMLAQIMRMLYELLARPGARTPPVNWIDGVRHNNLSGSGRILIAAGVTGVRVEVTAVPPTVSTSAGDPLFYWDLGFITPLAIDIPLRGQRIVFNPENFALPIQADGVSWSLAPGATINLVELLPA